MRAVIIGGGAAGMYAAVMLAQAGHSVTIYEKNEKLGKKQNNNNFGKLGRLKTETTDIQPSGRTSSLTSEQSYTNKHKQIKTIHDPLEIQYPGIIH